MENNFTVEATNDTPAFSINKAESTITINGVSMPENSFEFYDPLEKKALELISQGTPILTMEIGLTYLNSMSGKQLLKMIKLLSSRVNEMNVIWKYAEDDDLIKMKGEEIQTLCPKAKVQVVSMANS